MTEDTETKTSSKLPDGSFGGDGRNRVSNEAKTMCSSKTTKKSIESESEALAAVSHANRTLTQARQAVNDARATRRPLPKRSTAASARESERRSFLCRGPHLARDCPDRKKNDTQRFEWTEGEHERQEGQFLFATPLTADDPPVYVIQHSIVQRTQTAKEPSTFHFPLRSHLSLDVSQAQVTSPIKPPKRSSRTHNLICSHLRLGCPASDAEWPPLSHPFLSGQPWTVALACVVHRTLHLRAFVDVDEGHEPVRFRSQGHLHLHLL